MYSILWIIVTIACLVLEIATPSALVSIWFFPSGIIAFVLAKFNIDFSIQVISFFVSGIVFLLLFRPYAKEYLRGNTIATNADRVIGKRVRLLKKISEDNYGEVKVNGQIWNVISKNDTEIDVNTKVEILAIDGSKLIVKKVEE